MARQATAKEVMPEKLRKKECEAELWGYYMIGKTTPNEQDMEWQLMLQTIQLSLQIV